MHRTSTNASIRVNWPPDESDPPAPIGPAYTLTLKDVGENSASVEALATVDCTIRYTNSKFGEQEATTEIALSGDVPATIELTELVADQEYIFEALFVPADEELDDATRSVSYKTLTPPLPTPEYALTLLSVNDESAVIEATSNFDCTLEYSNRLVSDNSDTAPTDTVAVSKDVPAIITVRDLDMSTTYLFTGQFTPADDAIEGAQEEVVYTTAFRMKILEQTSSLNPNVGIVALPVQGKESTHIALNVSTNSLGSAKMLLTDVSDDSVKASKTLSIERSAPEAPAPTPALYFQEGFTAQGFQTISGMAIRKSTTYQISVQQLKDAQNNEYDDGTTILYTTADENVVNELTVQAEPLTGPVDDDGAARPGETGISLQIAVTQDSRVVYNVTDPSQNDVVPSPKFAPNHVFTSPPVPLISGVEFSFSTWIYIPASSVAEATTIKILTLTGDNPADQILVTLEPQRVIDGTTQNVMVGKYTGASIQNHSEFSDDLPIDTWFQYALVLSPRKLEGENEDTQTRIQHWINGVGARGRTKSGLVGTILNQSFSVEIAGDGFEGQLANIGIWDTRIWDDLMKRLYNTNELVELQTNVVRFGFGATTLIGTADVEGGEQTTVPVTDLTPATTYECKVVAASAYPTVTKELTVTTLAPIGQIDLSLSLERAPFPDNETTIRLFITVDVACSCEVIILGAGAVPPRFTETFDGPTVRRQLEFDGLLPNNTYVATVVASAPDMVGNEQTASIVTAAPFPNLTKLELRAANTTYASVTVDLDRPGSVTFHLESIDDPQYVREDVVATITQEDLDYAFWDGYTHLFRELVGSKSYKCICDTVLDVNGNEKPNGTEFEFTTAPPISVSATLTAPAVPQGRTALVAEVNANKQSSLVLVLSSAGGESYTQNYFNANAATRTFENLTPGTLYTLNVTARETGQTEEATTVVSASTLPPQFELAASLTIPQESGDTSLIANYGVNQTCSMQLFLYANATNDLVQLEEFAVNDVNVSLSFLFQNLTPSTKYDLLARAVRDLDGTALTATDSETTLAPPPPFELAASLSIPQESGDTSLIANYGVNQTCSMQLFLYANATNDLVQLEEFAVNDVNVSLSFLFQNLTPSTKYDLLARAVRDLDGTALTATDSETTQAPPPPEIPTLISVDILSNDNRSPFSGSTPTTDGHIVPLQGQFGEWNAIVTRSGRQTYVENELRNGLQEKTGISVVVNSNSAQHYTYGFYGGGKNNVGEDVIGLATAQNTGSIVDSYFTGLDDSKVYTMRMFGQHLNRPGDGSINFARFGVNGDKKDTGPDNATCSWYSVAPSQGRIDFSLEYINPTNPKEYASLGGFQLQEEPGTKSVANVGVRAQGRINFSLEYINPTNSNEYASLGGFQLQEQVSTVNEGFSVRAVGNPGYPVVVQLDEQDYRDHQAKQLVLFIQSVALDETSVVNEELYLTVGGLPMQNKQRLVQDDATQLADTNIVCKVPATGVYEDQGAQDYRVVIGESWVGQLSFRLQTRTGADLSTLVATPAFALEFFLDSAH